MLSINPIYIHPDILYITSPYMSKRSLKIFYKNTRMYDLVIQRIYLQKKKINSLSIDRLIKFIEKLLKSKRFDILKEMEPEITHKKKTRIVIKYLETKNRFISLFIEFFCPLGKGERKFFNSISRADFE